MCVSITSAPSEINAGIRRCNYNFRSKFLEGDVKAPAANRFFIRLNNEAGTFTAADTFTSPSILHSTIKGRCKTNDLPGLAGSGSCIDRLTFLEFGMPF